MKNTLKNNTCCFVSALFAGAFFLFACFHFKVFPFGSEYTLFKIDLVHQYAPMLNNFYDLVKEGKSLFYSWNAGLGYSFVGNFFNYIASPFNLIVFLFKREDIPNAINLIIMLKSMFIAGSFSYYIKRTFEKNDALNVGFSLLYTFSGWFVAYNWNIMWLDILFCLPLAVVGVQNIIKEKKFSFYIFILAYSLFTSYYMAYMLCLFLCLYFIYYYFTNTEIKKDFSSGFLKSNFFKSGVTFAMSSVVAACLVAVALVPMFFVVTKSSAVTDSIDSVRLFFNPFKFWSLHFSGVTSEFQIANKYDSPNVWCGMLTVLLMPVYFLSSKAYSKKERIADLGLWLFMALSLGVNLLCFVWCGFHFPKGSGDRFSYIYIFVALTITFKALMKIKEYKIVSVVASTVCAVAFITVMYFSRLVKVEKYMLIISFGFAFVWLVLFFVSKIKKLDVSLLRLIVFFFVCVELVFSQLENLDFNYYRPDYDGDSRYYMNTVSQIKEKDDEPFFRIESANVKAYIFPMIADYEGVSDFSSVTNYDVAKNQCALGLGGNEENYYTYLPQTPVYNSIFSIKYLMDIENAMLGNELFKKTDQNDNVSLYKNNYYLPLGYCISKETASFKSDIYMNPFYQQNEIFSKMSGTGYVFDYCVCNNVTTENASLKTIQNEDAFTSYYYALLQNNSEDGFVTFSFTLPKDGEYYLSCNYWLYSGETKILVGDKKINRSYKISNISFEQQGISNIGHQKKGTKVTVTIPLKKTKQNNPISVYVASFNKENFIKGYNKLNQHTLKLTEFENTHFKGTVTVEEDCLLFTSIPYDKGWHITLDGKPVNEKDVVAIDNAYISVPLTKGEHTVEFDFFPQGLKVGACISVVTAFGLIAYLIIIRKKKKKKDIKI